MTSRAGVPLALSAYVLFGLFPLYFAQLDFAGPIEVVLNRVLWSLLLCLLLVTVLRSWPAVRAMTRREVAGLGLAALVLSLNWGFFVYGVTSGQVVETSLGYFINPLVSVCLGVLVLRERLAPPQWAAVAIATVGVAVLTIDYGRPPWLALALALTFGVYGLLKRRVGRGVDALTGLTVETGTLAPFAAVGLLALAATGGTTVVPGSPGSGGELALLAGAGVLTAVPLLLFAAAARRVRLSTMGLLQYVTPVMHLLIGTVVFGEPLPPLRLAGFVLIWLALVVLTVSGLQRSRSPRTVLAR